MRSFVEERGLYLYYIIKAAKQQGVDVDRFSKAGLRELGRLRAKKTFGEEKPTSLKALAQQAMNDISIQVFDQTVHEEENGELVVRCGYCPILNAWVKLGLDDKTVKQLCGIVMEGDDEMYNSIPGVSYQWTKSVPDGDPYCEFRFKLK